MTIRVVDAADEHWRYISLCTHIDEENPAHLNAAEMRLQWLKRQADLEEMKIKVAIDEDGELLGFVHLVPIDKPLSGMIGRDLMVIPCITVNYKLVYNRKHGTGVGRTLVEVCEQEARRRGFKGLAVYAFTGDFWFMPSAFFRKVGFERVSDESNIWVRKWGDVEAPTEPEVHYEYSPVRDKVVVDYFWTPFCFTVCKEIVNIREVVSEFGDKVELREYRTDYPESFARYGMLRVLFINGQRKDWGYEAPKEELRKEIQKAIQT